jgi:hypothetical protein
LLTGLLGAALTALCLVPSAHATTFPVNNTSNAGAGSLRQAMIDANAAASPPHVIDATGVSGTIGLISALPNLSQDVEIRGPGASQLTVRRLDLAPAFGVFTVAQSEVKISGLTIANGASAGVSDGGGILVNGSLGVLTLDRTVVRGSEADEGGGVSNGLNNSNPGTVTIRNSTISGNEAGFSGGGIANAFGEMTIRNSTVSGNASGFGGGGITHRGTMTITNSTVTDNQADELGGGVRSRGTDTVLTVNSSTVSANNAPDGANLRLTGPNAAGHLRSTILSSPQGGGQNCAVDPAPVTLTSSGYNLASDTSCKLTKATDQPSTNPRLAPLASNGGPTRTMALRAGSQAIDGGNAGMLTTDQRGRKRPVVFPWVPDAPGGDGADIGAFELQSLTPPPEPPSNEFSFGKVKKNKRKGTAKLTVIVPGPGELDLAKTKKVKPQGKSAEGEGKEKLAIKPKRKSKRKLRKSGKAKVRADVTYTPTGGEPNTKAKKLKLKKRR